MKSHSWFEASLEVLRAGKPLTASEIVSQIESLELRDISGQTPEATVGAVLYTAIQNGDSRVRLAGPGLFEFGAGETTKPTVELGRLEAVNAREIWPDEAKDFTPWLLGNASYLGSVLGLEVELEAREHPVGPYSLDLFGRDLTNNCVLIVENQLTATDHRHLGQLLTYAAGTRPQAGTIVWVATEFRDEHRDAIEFLNARVQGPADNQIRFFGVQIGVVRIGNSTAAPQFTVVSSPSGWNDQMIEVQQGIGGGTSGKALAYRKFWSEFLDELRTATPEATKVRTAPAASWLTVNYLRKGVNVTLGFIGGGLVSTEVYIDLGDKSKNLEVLLALQDQRNEIESEVGNDLSWEEMPGKRACRIRLTRQGSVLDDDLREELIRWLVQNQSVFKKAFRSRVEQLSNEIWTRTEAADDESA